MDLYFGVYPAIASNVVKLEKSIGEGNNERSQVGGSGVVTVPEGRNHQVFRTCILPSCPSFNSFIHRFFHLFPSSSRPRLPFVFILRTPFLKNEYGCLLSDPSSSIRLESETIHRLTKELGGPHHGPCRPTTASSRSPLCAGLFLQSPDPCSSSDRKFRSFRETRPIISSVVVTCNAECG